MRLTGQVCVISGGSSGLGLAIAKAAAGQGATVVLLARRQAPLTAAVGTLQKRGATAHGFAVDVADATAVAAVVAHIAQTIGVIDILVNAAGFGRFERAVDTDTATMNRLVRVNLLGTMYLTQLVGRDMMTRRRGHIVNIGSMAGKMATPKSAVYAATKAGVIGYSNALRLELKPYGVRVTTVNPGPINTNFFAAADAKAYQQSVANLALDPDRLAARIVGAFHHRRRELNAPGIMAAAAIGYTLLPRVGDWLAGGVFNRK